MKKSKSLEVRRTKPEADLTVNREAIPSGNNDISSASLETSNGSFFFNNSLLVNPVFNLNPVEPEAD